MLRFYLFWLSQIYHFATSLLNCVSPYLGVVYFGTILTYLRPSICKYGHPNGGHIGILKQQLLSVGVKRLEALRLDPAVY